jgi:hypothetical protein
MEKLLIFYLTNNDRTFVFDKFKEELEKSKNIQNIHLLIVNSNSDSNYYFNILEGTKISYHIAHIYCPQSNYMPKVNYAIDYAKNNNFNFILKYDSDVLLPSYTIDQIFENIGLLNEDSNLTLSPLISNGIPTVEYFIDDFFSQEEAKIIREEFKKCEFHKQEGIMDYRPLNSLTINNNDLWDGEKYYDLLNSYIESLIDIGNGRTPENYSKFYRGMHPIRHGFGNYILNDMIISKKELFFSEKECRIQYDQRCRQLVAMCFCIKTKVYDRIINQENLIIDGCDEVPINRFGWSNNYNHLLIRNGYGIHIIYNWQWFLNNIDGGSNIEKPIRTIDEYETEFIKKLYE